MGAVLILFCHGSATILLGYLEIRRLVFNFSWRAVFIVSMYLIAHGAGVTPEASVLVLMDLALEQVFGPGSTTWHFPYNWLLIISVFSRSRWLVPSS